MIRCTVVVALVAGVGSCEARHGTPPPPPVVLDTEPVVVPGGTAAAEPEAVSRPRAPNPPLRPEEGSLAIELPPDTAPGVETTAHVRLTAHRGYEVNERFHYKLTLDPTPGVSLPKTVFTEAAHDAERLDGHELAIAMRLTADKPGDYTVHGKLDFAVCKVDSQCLPRTMPIAVQVAVR